MKWLVLAGYLIFAPFTYAALLAKANSISMGAGAGYAAEQCRSEAGTSAFLALLPPLWVGSPFVTGFYEHGLKWSCP